MTQTAVRSNALGAALALALLASAAGAQPSPAGSSAIAAPAPRALAPRTGGSPYRLRPTIDLPILGLATAGALAAFIEYPPPNCLPACIPPAAMNALDRQVVGFYSPTAHEVANVLVLSLVIAPLAIDLLDSRGDGWIEDVTVMLETVLVNQAVTQLTKSAVRRAAPFVYNDTVSLEERSNSDASRSFFSGHTSTSFSAATAFAVTYWLRHPKDPWRYVVLAASESLALGAGLLKIRAGYHYPTDVAAGALVGASLGVLIPMLHHTW